MAEVYTRVDLFKKLEQINSRFDADSTLRIGFKHFGIKDVDGNYTHCGGFGAFCKQWCELFGDYIDYTTKGSFQSGKLFYMTWKNLEGVEDAVQERKEDKKEKVELQQEEQEEVTSKEKEVESKESVVSEDTLVSEDSVEPEADKPEFDMEEVYKIKALADDKKQKIELEKYGRKFGVELSRRKSFDNMLADLKAAL